MADIFRKWMVLALLPLLVLSVACQDAEKAKKAYVERGNTFFKNSKYKEASIMYRSALKKDMKYGEAYYRLGLAELRLGRIGDAVRNLRRAYELQPDNVDAANQLANIYLTAYLTDPKKPKEFLKDLESISDVVLKKDPKSFLGLKIRGYVAAAAKNNEEALKNFEQAQAIKPFSQEIILPYIEALSISKRFDEGEKLAYQMIEKDKSFAATYDWLYLHYMSKNDLAQGEKIYTMKVQNNPKQSLFLQQLAFHYFMARRKEDMEKTLNRIVESPKEFPFGHVQVGDFYFRLRDMDRAVKYYEDGMKLENGAEQKAIYQKKIAQTLIERGRKKEALELVEQIYKANPKDSEAIAMRASLWLQDGTKEKVQNAIRELNSIIVRQPDNFVLRYYLGQAYASRGEIDQAVLQFQEAIKYRPDHTASRLALGQIHLAKNEFTKALQAAEDILAYDPNNVGARMMRSTCRIGLGDLPTARTEIGQVLAVSPNMPDALFQMGILNFTEKKYKEAEDMFLRLQKAAPNDPRGLVGQVDLYAATKRADEAIDLLQKQLKENPDRSFYRLALANTAVTGKKYELAITEYRKLMEKNPRNFDVQLRLAEVTRLKGDNDGAIKEFQKARELNPNEITGIVRLALLYEGAGKKVDAKPLYEQILKIDPENVIALNNLAFIMAEAGGDLDQALTFAQKAKAKAPNEPTVADTLGWIYIKKNLSDSAIPIFREIVEKDAKNPTYRYHYAVALMQKGDKPSAKRECQVALANNPTKDDEAKIRDLMSKI